MVPAGQEAGAAVLSVPAVGLRGGLLAGEVSRLTGVVLAVTFGTPAHRPPGEADPLEASIQWRSCCIALLGCRSLFVMACVTEPSESSMVSYVWTRSCSR